MLTWRLATVSWRWSQLQCKTASLTLSTLNVEYSNPYEHGSTDQTVRMSLQRGWQEVLSDEKFSSSCFRFSSSPSRTLVVARKCFALDARIRQQVILVTPSFRHFLLSSSHVASLFILRVRTTGGQSNVSPDCLSFMVSFLPKIGPNVTEMQFSLVFERNRKGKTMITDNV